MEARDQHKTGNNEQVYNKAWLRRRTREAAHKHGAIVTIVRAHLADRAIL